jgi:hypothetical protein
MIFEQLINYLSLICNKSEMKIDLALILVKGDGILNKLLKFQTCVEAHDITVQDSRQRYSFVV